MLPNDFGLVNSLLSIAYLAAMFSFSSTGAEVDHWGKHMFRRAVVGCTTVALAGGLAIMAPPASAAAFGQDVRVTVTGNGNTGYISKTTLHPGWLRLKLADATTKRVGVALTVVSMKRSYTISRLLKDIDTQIGDNAKPSAAAASTRDINKIAVTRGGGDVASHQKRFRADTLWLPTRTTYYVVNTSGTRAAVVATFRARGAVARLGKPGTSSTIHLGNKAGADVITLSGRQHLPTRGTIRIANEGGGIHTMVMNKVANNVTDAMVQAEFNTIMAGKQPTQDPAGFSNPSAPSVGVDALSQHHVDRLSYTLPKGTYLVLCFIADDHTGIPHAFMGMHKIVHVG